MRLSTELLGVAALGAALCGPGIAAGADPVPAAPTAPKEGAAPPAAAPAPATRPTDAIVTVNGVAITRAELERTTQALLAQNQMQEPTDPAQQEKIAQAAKDQMIAEEVLYQAAKKTDIPDLDKQVAAKFAEVKAQFPTQEAFEETLKKSGMTQPELQDLLRRDVLISAYIEQQIASKATVTAAQAKAFYDENLDRFKKPEAVHASHILIGVEPKATAEEKQAARQKADGLLAQVKGGADFAALAKDNSSCPSAKHGGDLGEFGRGQMVKPFEDVAFSLKPGEVSGVVETKFGYHIIKSTGKSDAGTVPFDEVKGKIEEYLKKQAVQQQMLAKIEELKQAAKIETPTPGQ